MMSNPKACLATDTAATAARLMSREKLSVLPVVEDRRRNRVIGVVRDRDLLNRIVVEGLDPHLVPISAIMSRDPQAVGRATGTRFGIGTASLALIGGFCLGIGAGLMFIFDPARGQGRRAAIRDQAMHLGRQSGNAFNRIVREVENRLTMYGKPESADAPQESGAETEAWELAQLRFSSSARVLASAAGGSLLLLALAKGKR